MIAGQPVYKLGRWKGRRFGYPGTRSPLPITKSLPAEPAAVLIHGPDGSVRTLCLDLDTSKAQKSIVDSDAAKLAQLFTSFGLAFVEDYSPSGGRHMYVPLQSAIPTAEARDLVEALELRTTSLDPGPHQNITDGCIRVPGSVHKRGGHQILITPLTEAYGILYRRNPSEAVEALRRELAPEIHQVHEKRRQQLRPLKALQTLRPGATTAAVPLSSAGDSPLRTVARTGLYSTSQYPSNSEARMAVLNHFAGCGWTLDQVQSGMTGSYAGLLALYENKADRLLAFEWAKAQAFTATKTTRKHGLNKTAHIFNTSPTELTRGGAHVSTDRSIHHLVNDLENVLYAVLDNRLMKHGRAGISLRFLIRAVLAYMRTNETNQLDVGCRTFAVALGKDHATIARLLPLLESASEGILTRVERGRGRNADLYLVQLPQEFEQLARDLTWRKGKIHAIRPVFRVLGDVAALSYEAIERGRTSPTTAELARTTGISRRALIDHLARMETLQMIRRHHGRWETVATTNLLDLADRMGVTTDRQAQINRYRKERAAWHSWLDRNLTPVLTEADLYDAEVDEYWLPPTDDPGEVQHSLWNAA